MEYAASPLCVPAYFTFTDDSNVLACLVQLSGLSYFLLLKQSISLSGLEREVDPRHLAILLATSSSAATFTNHSTSYAREATAHSSALDTSLLFAARNVGSGWIYCRRWQVDVLSNLGSGTLTPSFEQHTRHGWALGPRQIVSLGTTDVQPNDAPD